MRIVRLALLFLFISITTAWSQTTTVCATGSWDMANITPEKAKSYALQEAKAEALREAGVSEFLTIINAGSVSDQITHFISTSNSEFSGEIVDYKILSEDILKNGNHLFYKIDIEAVVEKGRVKRDLEFDAFIRGIKNAPYKNGEPFEFSVIPTKDCYVAIFWFDETGKGSIIYPNWAEPSEKLYAKKMLSFPRTQDYKAKKETSALIENITIMFVLTKEEIPYTNEFTLESLQKWILTIPSNQKVLKSNLIIITN